MDDKVEPKADGDVPWYEAEQERAITSWEVIVASMAAVPFLQAISTHLGNRLATAVDERTTKIVRRFLHRQVDEHGVRGSAPRSLSPSGPRQIHLQTEHGWTVAFHDDLPAVGLVQLFDLCKAAPPVPADDLTPGTRGAIYWHGNHWATTGLRGNGDPFVFAWDAEAKRWDPHLRLPAVSGDA
ncbi:hypothetical protein AB0D86_35870 [Streptomyces sp. NPDC048324]|uniref:hypothetical protein n=1 Tax=Streptomyces sp. NPDC048324 TaxID=3157205 RepID=UPI00341FC96C